jgi:hypothetical protein
MGEQTDSLLHSLPNPDYVRDRLRSVLNEADLWRRLLRLSERAERLRRDDPPSAHSVARPTTR